MKKSTKYAIIAGISFIFALIGLVQIFDYDNVGLGCVISGLGIICSIVFIGISVSAYNGKQEIADREKEAAVLRLEALALKNEATDQKKQKQIKLVKVLGTRAGLETRILGTYNFTIYSLLIVYNNGEREVVECESSSAQFKELIQYIETDKSPKDTEPLSVDEMIDMDEMND